MKKEIEMTINSYQTLYESAIAYGIRTALISEESKGKMSEQIKNIENHWRSYLEFAAFLPTKVEQTLA